LPRTQPRSVCQSVQGFNARSFPWANSHPGPLPKERENRPPMVDDDERSSRFMDPVPAKQIGKRQPMSQHFAAQVSRAAVWRNFKCGSDRATSGFGNPRYGRFGNLRYDSWEAPFRNCFARTEGMNQRWWRTARCAVPARAAERAEHTSYKGDHTPCAAARGATRRSAPCSTTFRSREGGKP